MMNYHHLLLFLAHLLVLLYKPLNRSVQHPFFLFLIPDNVKFFSTNVTKQVFIIYLNKILNFFFLVMLRFFVVIIKRIFVFIVLSPLIDPVIHVLEALSKFHNLLLLSVMYLLLELEMIV